MTTTARQHTTVLVDLAAVTGEVPALSLDPVRTSQYVRTIVESRRREAAGDLETAAALAAQADQVLAELAAHTAVSSGALRRHLTPRVEAQLYPPRTLIDRLLRR